MKVSLVWELTDQEYALLQRLVLLEGRDEAVETYATRVGLKGLRGTIETRIGELREAAITALTTAFDAADLPSKAAALDPLGYELTPDGAVQPKGSKP